MMILTLIIRNDRVTLGAHQDGTLIARAAIGADKQKTADEYAVLLKNIFDIHKISTADFEGAICASVVPSLTETLKDAINLLLGVRMHVIGSGIKTGLTIKTENPAELGADLVAEAVGALSKYTPPMILIHCGTAITFSYLDGDGAFLGCAIAPGLSLSAKALSDTAGLLPDVSHALPKSVIGTNTAESLRAGTILGTSAMIDGMLSRMEKEQDSAQAILSGTEADILYPSLLHPVQKDDTLALSGLLIIYEKNKRNKK